MHTVFALLCFVVVIHWLIFPYPSNLLHWHCGNLTIAPVPAKQPWWIWINTSCEFIINDCITTNKAKHNKTVCIFLGIYCTSCQRAYPANYSGHHTSSDIKSPLFSLNSSINSIFKAITLSILQPVKFGKWWYIGFTDFIYQFIFLRTPQRHKKKKNSKNPNKQKQKIKNEFVL